MPRAPGDPPIVDVDCHHEDDLSQLLPYLADPWRRHVAYTHATVPYRIFPGMLGDPLVGGRIRRTRTATGSRRSEQGADLPPTSATTAASLAPTPELADGNLGQAAFSTLKTAREALGVDVCIALPSPSFLTLAVHPRTEYEPVVAEAYARWITERVLPDNDWLRAMLYLPASNPDTALGLVEHFGELPGVAGFVLTSSSPHPLHTNAWVKVFRALADRKLPLGLHPFVPWQEPPMTVFNKFMAAYAYGLPLYNGILMTNLVVNGVFERVPGLRCVFYEAGLSWLPFVMHRLDNEYMMRVSEAPLLKKLPSEYIRDCYFSTQPLDWTDDDLLASLMHLVGDSRLLYASNYPCADFDLPSRIQNLNFLSDESKRRILGENAARLFRLHPQGVDIQ